MFKLQLFIYSIVLFQCAFAQTNGDSVNFKVACVPQFNNEKTGTQIIFLISNNRNENIEFVKEIIMVPKTSETKLAFILFEVYRCKANDTTDITSFTRVNIGSSLYMAKQKMSLAKGENYYFGVDKEILGKYFWEPGMYKIRFIVRKESVSPAPPADLYTDWLFINKAI